ncbi:MAG: Holliday junction DNA helicase RuvA [Paracoccaceae bacterium]|jgi:Holliday junction DNA helicase RuvA
MIGKIAGRLDYVAEDHALIEAAGVGYIIYCAPRTLARLPSPGEHAALYTEMVVREDLLQLYGFMTLAEKEWHRLLTSVQGVGAKAALAVLGALGPDGLARAIMLGDAGAIRRAPGIGPKIAARLVLELKDKAPTIMAMGARMARPADGGSSMPDDVPDDVIDDAPKPKRTRKPAAPDAATLAAAASAAAQADALSALSNLGYGMSEAAQVIAEAAEAEPTSDAAALIRAALRALAPRG